MQSVTAQAPVPRRPRVNAAALAAVVVGGALAITWLPLSLVLLLGGLSSLPALGAGVLLLAPWLAVMIPVVRVERRRAVAIHGITVILPPRLRSTRHGMGRVLQDVWFELGSGAFWRGVLHHHLSLLISGAFAVSAAGLLWIGWSAVDLALLYESVTLLGREVGRPGLGLIGFSAVLLAAGTLVLGALADRGLARGLISGSEEDLREQVAEMSARRRGAVDAAAQERLRIERDLHDGVQPRLVNLAMTLGLARSAIRSDPARAETLIGEAHAEAKSVMTDLRQLARGIHPAVLTDRGLDAALSALAARSRVPVQLEVSLLPPDRTGLDREREAVAYFLVAEALTNVAKHAGANAVQVTVREDDSTLHVRIRDDGRGGARVHRDGQSTGLAGLTDRVRATGGYLEVTSPPGGGTVLQATLPTGDVEPSAPRRPAPPAAVAAPPAARPTAEEMPR
ncbi:sensor histidine kinase [Brachybacterium sp. Marseille-Q7125]|uniref:sensor histidine kinase n=1 Tax=Brachybacterium sp. Marseille-Q7125 TaxID=2932815 RepID=UPI001FF2F515|nr:sensor histidine kinase [Brachybacterium sp. Marseille-Q7125]